MKRTLLGYVQTTLSMMDSDEVDSINVTTESLQVATLARDVYLEFVTRKTWDFLKRPISLVGGGNPAEPTRLDTPSALQEVHSLKYNISEDGEYRGRELKYMTPEDFLRIHASPVDDAVLVDLGSVRFYVRSDRMPMHWTSFDDDAIYLDAFDSAIETTSTSERVSCLASIIPEFSITDEFVPDLPERYIPMYQASLNAYAMNVLKQSASPSDNSMAMRQLASIQRQESRYTKREYYNNRYGRR